MSKLRELLTAGEMPRWIGLSMVSIILFGLAAVSYSTAVDTQREMASAVHTSSGRSVDLLAWMLSQPTASDIQARQQMLREFNQRIGCDQLRIVDGRGMVVASIDVDEIGNANVVEPELGAVPLDRRSTYKLESNERGDDRQLVIVPIEAPASSQPLSGAQGTQGTQAPRHEGTDPPDHDTAESEVLRRTTVTSAVYCVLSAEVPPILSAARARAGAVILTVVGLYLFLCRIMHRRYAGIAQISGNLRRRAGQVEEDLQALRVADNSSELSQQWNSFIDLVDDLSVQARRATASQELKEVLEKSGRGELSDVVNALPDGLLYMVESGVLGFANSTARRLMQMEEWSGDPMTLGELAVGDTGSQIIEQINLAQGANGSYNSITAVVEADNGASSYRIRTFSLNPRMGKSAAVGSCVVVITDISQQVRADKSAEEFVSQVTHELRTPLTNIRAYAETLASGVFDDPKVITECYNVITKETRRLSRLIEDMLSMSQLEVGTIQIHLDPFDLRVLLSDSVRDLRGIADDKQIDMQLSLPAKLPEFVGDRDKLAVVTNNLLGNALKYTPNGGSVVLACKASGDTVMITVKDTGMGVEKADHERIFEKFQRGSSPGVEDITGTGIGLTTAREIVRRHGGDIEVMSEIGQGATFIVSLPLKSAQTARGTQ